MKLKKLTALVSAAAMLGTMAFALTATAAETTLLSHPMDSEEAVSALIGTDTKYEPMVAENNGTEAYIELSYVKAGGTTSCMNMTDKNGWYNSAGLKYDITDLVADKSGALTISANVSANGATSSIQIGFMNDSGTKVGCENATETASEFVPVSYTAETIPTYNEKLYFYVTTGKPTLRINSLTLKLTTVDPAATLPIDDATFATGSIPDYYSTTGTGGLSTSNNWLIAKNITVNEDNTTTETNITAGSEFITINLGEEQLKAGDTLNIGFTYSNGNYGTASAANVYLDCNGALTEAGQTDAIMGKGGSNTASFSGSVTVPESYSGGDIKVVLKVNVGTGSPRIKDVTVSKAETPVTPATHEEGFKFTKDMTPDEFNKLTFKITATTGTETKTGTYTPDSTPLVSGDSTITITGLIITDVPEGTEITSIAFN